MGGGSADQKNSETFRPNLRYAIGWVRGSGARSPKPARIGALVLRLCAEFEHDWGQWDAEHAPRPPSVPRCDMIHFYDVCRAGYLRWLC
jgi:hypothetical protein